jgi:hypothetical protein
MTGSGQLLSNALPGACHSRFHLDDRVPPAVIPAAVSRERRRCGVNYVASLERCSEGIYSPGRVPAI